MPTYAVTYELNAPEQDYAAVSEVLKKSGNWFKYFRSFWIIDTKKYSAVQLRDRVSNVVSYNDKVMVMELTGDAAWINIDSKGSEWLKNHL